MDMFVAVYQFKVKEGLESEFVTVWNQLTQLIYKHEGSLGSRLHFEADNTFIAYAQWPSKETWENSGASLPDQAFELRKCMQQCCTSIETIHELVMVEDLIKAVPHQA